MVLQRDQPIQIWGKGFPGRNIVVTTLGNNKTTIVSSDSLWSLVLEEQRANTKPQSVRVTSANESIEIKNVLIGDVWLCIGQSNMQWPMEREMHFKSELQNANQSLIRFYNPSYAGENIFRQPFPDSVINRLNTANFYNGSWQRCDSNSIKTMSAVGYYFGKSILEKVQVPIGLIDLAIGGAPIETFINKETLAKHPAFASKVKANWLKNDSLPVWIRERGNQNVGGNPDVPRDEVGANHPYKPGFVFARGIQPLFTFPIKGIVWYQGESNAQEMERVKEYTNLTKLMVDDYRKGWGQSQLPFYWVQLSSIDTMKYKGHFWPLFRDEQRKMIALIENGGMAVCSDIGAKDDVHPRNKKDVGERLARWALKQTYHQNVVPSGPLPINAIYANGKVTISFQFSSGGLFTSGGKPLMGFSIDGKTDVAAKIENGTVIIDAPDRPAFVYYGWKPFSDGNLVNAEGLPASTFAIQVH